MKEFLESLRSLIDDVGFFYAIVILGSFYGVLAIKRIYEDRRKDKETNKALQEKEKTINRLIKENRELRVELRADFIKHMERLERNVILKDGEAPGSNSLEADPPRVEREKGTSPNGRSEPESKAKPRAKKKK